MDTVYEHLVTLLTDKFDVDAAQIRPDARLDGLDLDLLAVAELAVTLEEHWRVPPDEDTTADLTFQQLARTVHELLGTRQESHSTGTPQ